MSFLLCFNIFSVSTFETFFYCSSSCKQNQNHVNERHYPAMLPDRKGTPLYIAKLKVSIEFGKKHFAMVMNYHIHKNINLFKIKFVTAKSKR